MGWSELYDDAATRGGVVAVSSAPAFGIARRRLDRRAADERWQRPQKGVVALPGSRLDLVAQAHAALLAAGERSLVAGHAALHLWGVCDAPAWIDVVVPVDRDVVLRPPARCRRSRTLLEVDAAVVHGIRCTTARRSLLDVAAWHGATAATPLLLDACQRRVATAAAVRERAGLRSPIRGRGDLVRTCDLVDLGIASAFEARVLPLLCHAGLPPPVPQAAVDVGGRTLHVDFGWPGRRVGVECLGLRFHNDRRALRTDVRRMNAFDAIGWSIVWVEWEGVLHEPERIVAEVRRRLAA